MAFPVTLNGRTYTLADFEGTNYVDGLPDAFEDFVTQAGDIYNSTSTSSVAIGTGSKTFTTADSGKPYQAGTPLRIADAAAPETNFMDAIVTSYSGTTLVVDVFGYAGSGTKTSWTINIGGAKTVDGTLAISQGGTGATSASGARTNLDVYSKADADSRFLNVSGEASNVTMTGDVTIGDTSGDTLTVNATASFSGDVGIGTDSPSGITSGITALSISDSGAKTTGDKIGALTFVTDDGSYTGTYSDGVGVELSAVAESATGGAYGLVVTTGTVGSAGRDERLKINNAGNIIAGDSLASSTAGPILGGCAFEIRDTGGSEFVAGLQIGGFVGSDQFCGGFAIRNSDPSGDGNHSCGIWGKQSGSVSTGFMDLCFAAGRDLYDAESAQMILTKDGALGIGTSSPSGANVHMKSSTDNFTLRFQNDTVAGGYIQYMDTDEMRFYTASSIQARINSSGNFLINATGDSISGGIVGSSAKFKVVGSSGNTVIANTGNEIAFSRVGANYISAANTGASLIYTAGSGGSGAHYWRVGQTTSNNMILDGNGNLVLSANGTGTPGHTIYGSGAWYVRSSNTGNNDVIRVYDSGGTLNFTVDADGDVANTNNSYGALSDERIKSNIADASSQIDDIMAVQVRNYTLDSTGDTHIGVIAQELEASGMFGLVKENEEGMKSVKYSVLYMKAIKALQEAVTRIETLEAEVTALKGAN